ncbi:MAG TPA: ferritin-like domain-containing protein [Polyangiaceae bacterium]
MEPSLASTFRWLLLVAGGTASALWSCVSSSSTDGCDPPRRDSTERTVAAATLAAVLEDLEITQSECIYSLCDFENWARVDACTVTFRSESPNSGDTASGSGGSAGGAADREVSIRCSVEGLRYYCEGRRHVSWARREAVAGTNLVGRWFADAAANEAASVQSFRALDRELRRCGVRSSGVLRRAARQEIGHARLLDRLARARGSERPKQAYVPGNARSLVEIVLENAREGCVAETYAGLVALHQAGAARDPEVRRVFASIAREEAEHAELAWALHAELRMKLTPGEQRQLDQALESALDTLARREFDWTRGLAADAAPAALRGLAAELGMPSRETESRLRQGLAGALRERAQRLVA